MIEAEQKEREKRGEEWRGRERVCCLPFAIFLLFNPLSLFLPLHTLSVRVALAASHRDGNKCIERSRWGEGER